jgi:hypothetical protein
MAWTQEDLTTLDAAIASGAMRVKYKDREVTYRSQAEMLQARSMIRRELGLDAGNGRRVFQITKGT